MGRLCLLLLVCSVAVAAALPEAGSARHAGADPATAADAAPKRSLLVIPGVFGKGERRVVPTETTEMFEVIESTDKEVTDQEVHLQPTLTSDSMIVKAPRLVMKTDSFQRPTLRFDTKTITEKKAVTKPVFTIEPQIVTKPQLVLTTRIGKGTGFLPRIGVETQKTPQVVMRPRLSSSTEYVETQRTVTTPVMEMETVKFNRPAVVFADEVLPRPAVKLERVTVERNKTVQAPVTVVRPMKKTQYTLQKEPTLVVGKGAASKSSVLGGFVGRAVSNGTDGASAGQVESHDTLMSAITQTAMRMFERTPDGAALADAAAAAQTLEEFTRLAAAAPGGAHASANATDGVAAPVASLLDSARVKLPTVQLPIKLPTVQIPKPVMPVPPSAPGASSAPAVPAMPFIPAMPVLPSFNATDDYNVSYSAPAPASDPFPFPAPEPEPEADDAPAPDAASDDDAGASYDDDDASDGVDADTIVLGPDSIVIGADGKEIDISTLKPGDLLPPGTRIRGPAGGRRLMGAPADGARFVAAGGRRLLVFGKGPNMVPQETIDYVQVTEFQDKVVNRQEVVVKPTYTTEAVLVKVRRPS